MPFSHVLRTESFCIGYLDTDPHTAFSLRNAQEKSSSKGSDMTIAFFTVSTGGTGYSMNLQGYTKNPNLNQLKAESK